MRSGHLTSKRQCAKHIETTCVLCWEQTFVLERLFDTLSKQTKYNAEFLLFVKLRRSARNLFTIETADMQNTKSTDTIRRKRTPITCVLILCVGLNLATHTCITSLILWSIMEVCFVIYGDFVNISQLGIVDDMQHSFFALYFITDRNLRLHAIGKHR